MSPFRSSFLENIPPVVKNLIIINVLFWLASITLPRMAGLNMEYWLGLHFWEASNFYPFQIISYMFLHGSFEHLFFNMFGLFMFGRVLEYTWGNKRFLTYYMVTGIGAGVIQLLVIYAQIWYITNSLPQEFIQEVYTNGAAILDSHQNYMDAGMAKLNILLNMSTIGASGAIFGLLLAFGMLFPNQPIFLMFIPIPIKAKYFVIGYAVIELFMGVGNFQFDNVAHFAHLGGMLFGYFLIRKWKKGGSYGH